MKFFKPKIRPLNPRAAERAERWADGLLRVQRRIADRLNRRTAYWNRPSKIIALVLFCLAFGGLSAWLLFKSIF